MLVEIMSELLMYLAKHHLDECCLNCKKFWNGDCRAVKAISENKIGAKLLMSFDPGCYIGL